MFILVYVTSPNQASLSYWKHAGRLCIRNLRLGLIEQVQYGLTDPMNPQITSLGNGALRMELGIYRESAEFEDDPIKLFQDTALMLTHSQAF